MASNHHRATAAPSRSAAATLIADHNFLRLWAAGGLDGTIRWLDVLAVGVFTYQVSHSALWVSLVLFLRLFPMFLFGAVIGAIAERIDRRRLLVAGMPVLAVSYGVLGTLAFTGWLELWHVALGCLISGFFWAVEIPVRRTMLMEVVGVARIGQAMGLESSTQNFTRMLGPPLGGLFLEWLGMYGAYWMGALLCSGSAMLISGVAAGSKPAPGTISGNLLANIRDGLRYIRTDRIVVATLFCTVAVNLFGFSYIAMVPVIGQSELELTAFPIGLLMSAEGAGAFIGALLVAFYGVSRQFHRMFLYGSFLYLAGVLGFSLAGSYPFAMIVLLVGGMGIAGFSSMQSTLILSQTPPELRNRVMGVLAVCIGFGPIGVLNVGFLAHQFGPRTAITIIGCLGLLCLTFAALRWPELRAQRSGD